MDSFILWWLLCRMLYLLWKKIFLDIILYITFNGVFFFLWVGKGIIAVSLSDLMVRYAIVGGTLVSGKTADLSL